MYKLLSIKHKQIIENHRSLIGKFSKWEIPFPVLIGYIFVVPFNKMKIIGKCAF